MLKPYRTVIVVLSCLVGLVFGYWLGLRWPAGGALFPVLSGAICGLATIGAAKSTIEHVANAKKPEPK